MVPLDAACLTTCCRSVDGGSTFGFCHSFNCYQSWNDTEKMSLSISSIKTLLKLNTCVQRIQGVVAVPGVSSVSVRLMWPCARLNSLFVRPVSVQSFPTTSSVDATCSRLFWPDYFWYVAPKRREFGFRRHLPTGGLRSCTAYSVLLEGSASFPEIPS